MLLRNASLVGMPLLLAVTLTVPAGAAIFGEGVTALHCTEGDDLEMPKRMEFMQVVLTDDFEGHDRVALFLEAEYAEDFDVNKGQIIAAVTLLEADGTVRKLGKVKAKFREGEAGALKVVDAEIEEGDVLNWKVKTRGLPALRAELEDCLNFYFVAVVADEEELLE